MEGGRGSKECVAVDVVVGQDARAGGRACALRRMSVVSEWPANAAAEVAERWGERGATG